ncbi:hypothetical protein PENSTE_c003G09566 [Penicillium steckii]|uniref:Tubby C-terminal domain-containing protein n=1 Tax=Penicillium steckii TaxID=303698 RepID=A0A1V6TS46_9EURO|nr:hypothetical protein PENSTE_c003G09566 [Penicillium steckii]
MSDTLLPPVARPVALFEQFIATQPTTLVLKEKVLSISKDSFDIKLENGSSILKVNGAWPSFSGRKKVEDMNGNHLYDLRKEHLHIHTTYYMQDATESKICEVRSSLKIIGSNAAATFTDIFDNEVTLRMTGNWFDRTANIVDDQSGQTVARIRRKLFQPRHIFFGQDTYIVTVAPGVDMALIAGLCICFDEKNND